MIGKVTVWKMTEEERLAYIKKHPIVPTGKVTGATFNEVPEKQREKAIENSMKIRNEGKRIIDHVDKDLLHKLFIKGEKLDYIAKKLKISSAILNNYIKEQRKINPEKWPYRR
jgi:23S rRNA pseudoU1915 N3-methylase RlmH